MIPLGSAAPAATPPPGQLLGIGQNSEDEPLYVNAKQYHRILKRRAARAKIEEGNKGNKAKKVLCSLMTFFFNTNDSLTFMNLVINMQCDVLVVLEVDS